jgi:predicted nuclease of restriction endonuclease-like (RecB) superfamily
MASQQRELPDGYAQVLAHIKAQVRSSQLTAIRSINTELVRLYWSIGKLIIEQQEQHGRGAGAIDRLAADLRAEFPGQKGFSPRNLWYTRAFAAAWTEPVLQQAVAELPWGHVTVLLDKLDTRDDRDWYAAQAVAGGWSRGVLLDRIKGQLRQRRGAATSNFERALASPDSDLAQQITKDPYVFDFLNLDGQVAERELEDAMMGRLQQALLELGVGFAFVGRRKRQPTVGLLLCTDRNDTVVRYALGGMSNPMAVAGYTYESLPVEARRLLPSPEVMAKATEAATNALARSPRGGRD